jgi:hypothetical protein
MEKIPHLFLIKSNLWDAMVVSCSCGWEAKHYSPWPAKEMVDVCNEHLVAQRRAQQKKRQRQRKQDPQQANAESGRKVRPWSRKKSTI